jgi:Cys-tRNA(Pro)/Cys-tRNA(Cys) deacylase
MTPAVTAAQRAGVRIALHEFEHDPGSGSYGLEAAARLGVDAGRVFKTLVAKLDDGRLAVGVVPVERSLDLKAMAAALGAKRAAMAGVSEAERATGYVVGGISPLGQRKRLPTALDQSALAFDRIFVSAGRRGLEIELSPADLLRVTGGCSAPVAR